jgi:ubiquinone/menaquinone biosynthesis C-methylase UbiE
MSNSPDARAIPDQIAFWNQDGGAQWTRRQESWDVTLAPVSDAVLDRAAVQPGQWAIDIGCGCGATVLELARRVGAQGRVLGIDVSKPMLARAQERSRALPQVRLTEADATTHEFERGAYDLLFSRFGVMFFPDPPKAFTNLRGALKPSGRLAFACFRSPKENPFMMTAYAAVADLVPPLPKMAPEDPGPFAFADEARVRRILDAAGFKEVALEPVNLDLDVGSGKGVDEAVINALEIGPSARALREQPPELRAKGEAAIRQAFAAKEKNGRIPLTAAIWIVTAKA